jgi:hypothetical protein
VSSVIEAFGWPSIRWTAFTFCAHGQGGCSVLQILRRDEREAVVSLLALAHRWFEHPRPPIGVTQNAPRWSVNTNASRSLPTMSADCSSASAAGKGTDRRSWVFGVLHCSPPDSVTERDMFTDGRQVLRITRRRNAGAPVRARSKYPSAAVTLLRSGRMSYCVDGECRACGRLAVHVVR